MAGMKIHKVNVLKNGKIDMNHLTELAKKYEKDLACAMITYPSTYGVFDAKIV
jgi:glycine dehydrogenase